MRYGTRKSFSLLGLFLLSASLFAQPASQPEKLKIIASIFPLWEFAKTVAAERGDVSLLLPPGAGVHTWQPRVSDMLRLSSARIFIHVGAGLEPWIPGLLRSVPSSKTKTLALAELLPLIKEKHEGEEGVDPHVWLDFSLDQMMVDRIAETLGELDPAGASFYKENAARLNERLAKLDALFVSALGRCRDKKILIGGHAAFGYLARRYGLEQVALYGLSPDAEPTPSRLKSAVELAKQYNIKTVFMEANTSAKMARVLAQEIRAEVYVLNSGHNLNKKQLANGVTFFDIMEENLQNLRKGLGCE